MYITEGAKGTRSTRVLMSPIFAVYIHNIDGAGVSRCIHTTKMAIVHVHLNTIYVSHMLYHMME